MKTQILNLQTGDTKVIATPIIHPIHNMYHLQFSDGYENIFFNDIETGEWIEQDMGKTELATDVMNALQDDLKEKKKCNRNLSWIHQWEDDKLIHFGFHHYKLTSFDAFEIYSNNHRYLFTIVKITDYTWQVFRLSGPAEWTYNTGIIDTLPDFLDHYTA